MTNIWRKEYEEGIEIIMPHRPKLDDAGVPVTDEDGIAQYELTRVRSLSAGYILKKGRLPAGLVETAISVLMKLGIAPTLKDVDADTGLTSLEQLEGWVDFQHFIVDEMVIYPKIVDKPKKDDEISFEMLSADDIMFYISLIEQPLANLRPFPRKAAPSLATVPASESNGVSPDSE